MPELTREEKLKLVEKLPQKLQEFLYSEDTGAVLLYFGKKYNLPDEKVRLLSKLVGDIVLGITPITSTAQEINSKIISDPQTSMHIAQELYAELLAPVMAEAKPVTPTVPIPTPRVWTPTPVERGVGVDQYREPVTLGPEVVDLRKTPPPQIPAPVSPAPIPPSPRPAPPLTFTKPVEPPAVPQPLIEANPHIIQEKKIPEISSDRPQFIIRPPGLAPTDAPHNVLDLRKDKGEF